MVCNVMDHTDVKAQDVSLNKASIKPYMQYGIGIKKSWGERFSGWAQIVLRSGGRKGIAGQVGFKWSLGKDTPKSAPSSSQSIQEIKKTQPRSINLTSYNRI